MTTVTTVDVGDMRRIGNHSTDPVTGDPSGLVAFLDDVGDDANPTEVRLTVQKPDGTKTVYVWPTPGVDEEALTKEAAVDGRFYTDVEIDQDGIWRTRMTGTGAVVAAARDYFIVRASFVTAP